MPNVLVTGAAGYLGSLLVADLAAGMPGDGAVIGTDIRRPAAVPAGVTWRHHDVREAGLEAILREHRAGVVVHLASIVTPGPGSTRALQYEVDVGGTRRVLEACIAAGVRRIVVTSSGAAYGYHPDNPVPIREDAPVRGHPEFAYADHKRLVEEMLAEYRAAHPALEQVVFRVGTVLGATTDNQITALFRRRRPLAIRGASSPFVFVWDRDVVACLRRAVADGPPGIFNLAGDGALTMTEIAARMGARPLIVPAWALRAALALAAPLGLTRYGPEQLDFLRYRPVLSNERLKSVFGFTPLKSTAETFELWRRSQPR